MSAYTDLEARFRRLGAVEEAIAVLHWDAAAMMPAGGGAARAQQLATLRGIAHQLLAAPGVADLLAAADTETSGFGPLAARQSARDAAPLAPRRGGAGRSRRGLVARQIPV